MPRYYGSGGGPAEWAQFQQGRRDDQIRNILNMMMMAKEAQTQEAWKNREWEQGRADTAFNQDLDRRQTEAQIAADEARIKSLNTPGPTLEEVLREFEEKEKIKARYAGAGKAGETPDRAGQLSAILGDEISAISGRLKGGVSPEYPQAAYDADKKALARLRAYQLALPPAGSVQKELEAAIASLFETPPPPPPMNFPVAWPMAPRQAPVAAHPATPTPTPTPQLPPPPPRNVAIVGKANRPLNVPAQGPSVERTVTAKQPSYDYAPAVERLAREKNISKKRAQEIYNKWLAEQLKAGRSADELIKEMNKY